MLVSLHLAIRTALNWEMCSAVWQVTEDLAIVANLRMQIVLANQVTPFAQLSTHSALTSISHVHLSQLHVVLR